MYNKQEGVIHIRPHHFNTIFAGTQLERRGLLDKLLDIPVVGDSMTYRDYKEMLEHGGHAFQKYVVELVKRLCREDPSLFIIPVEGIDSLCEVCETHRPYCGVPDRDSPDIDAMRLFRYMGVEFTNTYASSEILRRFNGWDGFLCKQ